MNELFKYIKSDKILKWSFQISVALLLFQIVYLAFSYFSLPPLIPLYNQLPWGEARLGSRLEIFIPSGITLMIIIGNLLFVNKLYNQMPLLSRLLSITTLLISILSFIFTLQTLTIIL